MRMRSIAEAVFERRNAILETIKIFFKNHRKENDSSSDGLIDVEISGIHDIARQSLNHARRK